MKGTWRQIIVCVTSLLAYILLASCRQTTVTTKPGSTLATMALAPDALSNTLASDGHAAIARGDHLWLSDEQGRFRLVAQAPTGGYFQDPALSPGGDDVAYSLILPQPTAAVRGQSSDFSYQSTIWRTTATGTQSSVVAGDTSDALYDEPVWSPDGRSIYYVRTELSRHDGVAGVLRRIEATTISTAKRLTIVDDAASPDISPDGQWLAFVRMDSLGRVDLWVRRLATGETRRVTDGRFVGIESPRFAPTGETIAFAAALPPLGDPGATAGANSFFGHLLTHLAAPAYAHDTLDGVWMIDLDGTRMRPVGDFYLDTPTVRWTSDRNRLLVYDEVSLVEVDVVHGLKSTILHPGSYRGFDWLMRS
jgi:Tol biopolymer transport system component